MYNKNNLLVNLGFVLLFVILMILTGYKEVKDQKNKEQNYVKSDEKSFFDAIRYFKIIQNRPSVKLVADYLEIINNNKLIFKSPDGTYFSNDNVIHYTSEYGTLNQNEKELRLNGSVRISESTSEYAGHDLTYNGNTYELKGWGGIEAQYMDERTLDLLELKATDLISNLKTKEMELKNNVSGRIIRKHKYEGQMDFSSEVFLLKSLDSLVKLEQKVKINRNNYHLESGSAEIFLENYNKKLKYYVLYDDVKLEEKLEISGKKAQVRRAYSEKLEGHQRSAKVVLTGAPRVEQGKDVIQGYQITLRENVELVEVDDAQSSFNLKKDN